MRGPSQKASSQGAGASSSGAVSWRSMMQLWSPVSSFCEGRVRRRSGETAVGKAAGEQDAGIRKRAGPVRLCHAPSPIRPTAQRLSIPLCRGCLREPTWCAGRVPCPFCHSLTLAFHLRAVCVVRHARALHLVGRGVGHGRRSRPAFSTSQPLPSSAHAMHREALRRGPQTGV